MGKRFTYYYGVSLIDPDAQNFFDATSITDATTKAAVNSLVVDLKTNNLWDKMYALYPFVGGTDFTNKFNLKNPQDLDSAFRLSYFGGATHTNGYNPNGVNGYADTHVIPNNTALLGDEHLSIASNTNNTPLTNDSVDMGAFDTVSKASLIGLRNSTNKNLLVARLNGGLAAASNVDAAGVFIATKKNIDNVTIYRDGVNVAGAISNSSLSVNSIFIGTLRTGTIPYGGGYTNQNYTFASYGKTLNDTEAATLTTIINTFNTNLGR